MKKKFFVVLIVFFSFMFNVFAEGENITVVEKAKNDKLFAVRMSISNDQKFDIDGDGKPDIVERVTISKKAQPPSFISLITPWIQYDEETKISNSLDGGSHNNLLVTFGNSKQVLIHDVNDVSVLDTDAAQEISIASKLSLVELELPELNKLTKGDVIVIPTEAGIDTYLYWNGSTFLSYEPAEIP